MRATQKTKWAGSGIEWTAFRDKAVISSPASILFGNHFSASLLERRGSRVHLCRIILPSHSWGPCHFCCFRRHDNRHAVGGVWMNPVHHIRTREGGRRSAFGSQEEADQRAKAKNRRMRDLSTRCPRHVKSHAHVRTRGETNSD